MSQNTGKIESEPRKPDHALKLHHIGEPLVAAMLQDIAASGDLSKLKCPKTGQTVEEDLASEGIPRPLQFLSEEASLRVKTGTDSYECDGAQKVDVLCASDSGKAMAFELKLGEERLQAVEFKKRFQNICESSHKKTRLKGSMISVLDRNFDPSWNKEAVLSASTDSDSWEVVRPWWLVVRERVWLRWKRFGIPEMTNARFLIFEELVDVRGGPVAFNETVCSLLSGDFYQLWELNPKRS